MKRIFSLMIIFMIFNISYGQRILQPEDVWAGMIEIEQGTLMRHVLNDIPGSIVVLIQENERIRTCLLARKILKEQDKLPKINLKPTNLMSSFASRNRAAGIGILSFITASMGVTDEVKFIISETSHSSILDSDIDWDAFNKRVDKIKERYPDESSKAIFGVVKVANIISIYYEIYKRVSKASKIFGWGFNAEGKCLSEKGVASSAFKVGVALAYPDSIIRAFENQLTEIDIAPRLEFKSLVFEDNFGKSMNIYIARNLMKPGYFVDDIDDLFIKE